MVIYKPTSQTFEDVVVDEWIEGKITAVNDRVGEQKNQAGQMVKVDQIRFTFELKGYDKPHHTRWFNLSTYEKANLYKFLIRLIPDFKSDKAVDFARLVGMHIKVMYEIYTDKKGNKRQGIASVKPIDQISFADIEYKEEEEKAPF